MNPDGTQKNITNMPNNGYADLVAEPKNNSQFTPTYVWEVKKWTLADSAAPQARWYRDRIQRTTPDDAVAVGPNYPIFAQVQGCDDTFVWSGTEAGVVLYGSYDDFKNYEKTAFSGHYPTGPEWIEQHQGNNPPPQKAEPEPPPERPDIPGLGLDSLLAGVGWAAIGILEGVLSLAGG